MLAGLQKSALHLSPPFLFSQANPHPLHPLHTLTSHYQILTMVSFTAIFTALAAASVAAGASIEKRYNGRATY